MINKLMLFLICIEFIACSTPSRSIPDSFASNSVDSLTLSKGRPILLPVDNLTPNYSSVIQTFTHDAREMLAFLQGPIIHIYDIESQAKYETIEIDEDAEGLGRLMGFKIKNLDSILVTNRYEAHFVNRIGKKFQSFSLLNNDLQPCGFSFGTGQILFVRDKVHFITIPEIYATDYKTMGSLEQVAVVWDYNDDSFLNYLRYPKELTEKVFPAQMTLMPFATYNSNTDKVIYSFGALHYLIESGLNRTEKKHEAISSKYSDIPETSLDVVDELRKREKYSRTTPHYLHILYDEYRDVYYRIVTKPISDEDFKNGRWAMEPYVIILNKNFKKVGEVDLGEGFSTDNMLVSKRGLMVLSLSNDNEDVMRFEVFELTRN